MYKQQQLQCTIELLYKHNFITVTGLHSLLTKIYKQLPTKAYDLCRHNTLLPWTLLQSESDTDTISFHILSISFLSLVPSFQWSGMNSEALQTTWLHVDLHMLAM